MYFGNDHSCRRRVDDLRYLPGDLRRRARSFRERLLANWAGSTLVQRLSTSALALAVVVAIGVVVTAGGEIGSGSDLVVATEGSDRVTAASANRPARTDEVPTAAAAASSEPAIAPDSSVELSMVDNSAVVDEFGAEEAEVLGVTTVPGRSAGAGSVVATGNPFDRFFPAFNPPATAVPAPPPATNPPAAPAARPPATSPPATSPPVTSPPATSPPVTAPPVTAPPVTTPPVTAPPTTAAPVTTAPPVTVLPTTAPTPP